jgi:hypothetical protein
MGTYGRQVLGSTGTPLMVLADGLPEWKHGGVTIDWSKVAAVDADTTLPDGLIVKDGRKHLRYGQVLCRIGTREEQTVTVTADSGDYTLTYDGEETAAIEFDATSAEVEAALEALDNIVPGDVAVTGSAGGPYTVKFRADLGDVGALTADDTNLVGAGAGVVIATTVTGAGSGKFGPYDPAATDGRQVLSRGDVFILNQSVLELGVLGIDGGGTDHPGVLEGGRVWRERVLATDGVAALDNGPTYAALETAMPRLSWVKD